MNALRDIDLLIGEIEKEITDGVNLEISEIKKQKYNEYLVYLKDIRQKLAIENYKFIFIGDKGIGKTTTILELFGLVYGEEDLLTTASGGTTTCEVEILKSDKDYTYFEIVPTDDEVMKQYVYDFCLGYAPQDEEESKNTQYIPTEIARSIRNMIRMKKNEIINLYNENSSFDDFVKNVSDRLDLENRTTTKIKCESDEESLFKEVQRNFEKINLCKFDSIKLPQKIKLFITESLLDFSKYPSLRSIVDTRGIDSNISSSENKAENKKEDNKRMKREDILNYIDKEEDECIFLFMDGIKPAPSLGILELFSSRIRNDNSHKFYLVVNVYDKEAEEVMTDDGKANNMQIGIDYKKDDILEKFSRSKSKFIDSNLLFYNARKDIPSKVLVLNKISDNIAAQKDKLLHNCSDLKRAFEKLKFDFENKNYAFKNFDELYSLVLDVSSPQRIFDDVINKFFEDISNQHHARIAAVNRNNGNYYGYNFYHRFSLTIEDIFDEIFKESKDDVIKKVKEFFAYKNINDVDRIDYTLFIDKLERDYVGFRGILKDTLKQILQQSFRHNSWINAQAEYGKKMNGKKITNPPYKKRILDIYRNEMLHYANSCDVRAECDAKWKEILKRNYLDHNQTT